MRQIPYAAALALLVGSIAITSGSVRTAAAPRLHDAGTEQGALPDAPGRDVVERTCTTCHGADYMTAGEKRAPEWRETLDIMKSYGATASDDDWKVVGDYLVANLASLSVNKAPVTDLALVLAIPAKAAEGVAAYRDTQGGFKSIDDLKKAPEVDATRIDAVRARLVFE